MESTPSKEQEIQEQEYSFPYHYIPSYTPDGFSQNRHWSWGYRYMGGLLVAMDLLGCEYFYSLADVGCGDGRFLREVHERFPKARLLGIDTSQRAIGFARAFNPHIPYKAADLLRREVEAQFDVVTSIEVLEHIPPDRTEDFVRALSGLIKPHGRLVLTVPHLNKPLNPKHFQHFSRATLETLLTPHFESMKFVLFDDIRSLFLKIVGRLLGGSGSGFVITQPAITNWFFQTYLRRHLYVADECCCGRLAVLAVKGPQ